MSIPPWWRARSLAERAEDMRHGAAAPERVARWEQALPDPEMLAERLSSAGVPPARLAAALAEHPPPWDVEAPDWWRFVTTTLAPGTRSPVRDVADAEDADVLRGALRLVAPFARRVQAQLRQQPSAREDAIRLLTHNVAFELAELCRPALALELTATRAAEGWVPAEAAARAARLLRAVGRAETAQVLFHEHPGLARMVAQRARCGLDNGRELLDRLTCDLPRVRDEILGGEEPGPISELVPAGDAHEGGRRVLRIGFATGARVVYKPRSLATDLAYQRLLTALTRRGLKPGLGTLATILGGPQHGWQEWAMVRECDTAAGAARYYRRLGAQLAVLYALYAVDLHQENVLACGEHPALVDLECVLHPRLGGARAAVVDPEIAETGTGSVLRVGLLPRADVAFGVDIGGLGRDPLGRVAVAQLDWVSNAGEAWLENRSIELPAGPNVPRLAGEPVRAQQHVGALATGFADAYRLLLAHRDELLAPGGELAAFGNVPIRLILRPTKVYVDLLRRQHSDAGALDDGLVREEALNVLWRGSLRRPDLRIAAPAEHHDLWHGDVPKITGTPGSSDGRHHALGTLGGLLSPQVAPGPEAVHRLDERDLERQVALLRASVLAADARPVEVAAAAARVAVDGVQPAPPPGGMAAGVRLAVDRLSVLALRDEQGRAGWLTPVAASNHPGRVLRAAGPGLADGQAGIALFLGLAAGATGDGQAGELARAAVDRLLVQLSTAPAQVEGVGLGSGAGGMLLALCALAGALGDRRLHDRARMLAIASERSARAEPALDTVRGLAGWVTGLASLVSGEPHGAERELLRRDAARLARAAAGRDATLRAGRALALDRAASALGSQRPAAAVERREAVGERRPTSPHLAAALDAGDGALLTPPGVVEAPGIAAGVAGVGLTCLAAFDQVAAEAAAAALFCNAP